MERKTGSFLFIQTILVYRTIKYGICKSILLFYIYFIIPVASAHFLKKRQSLCPIRNFAPDPKNMRPQPLGPGALRAGCFRWGSSQTPFSISLREFWQIPWKKGRAVSRFPALRPGIGLFTTYFKCALITFLTPSMQRSMCSFSQDGCRNRLTVSSRSFFACGHNTLL